jgi:hypothetical protein
MVRGIVANEARDGSTPFARSKSPRPMDPVDGLLSRRCWFESNSGRHVRSLVGTCEISEIVKLTGTTSWFIHPSISGSRVRAGHHTPCARGGIGRHAVLRGLCFERASSTLAGRTNFASIAETAQALP